MELPHVEHRGKSRFSIFRGLGLYHGFVCRSGTFRRGSAKLWCNRHGAKPGGRSERDRKRPEGSAATAAAHQRPDSSAVQVMENVTRLIPVIAETKEVGYAFLLRCSSYGGQVG